MTVTILPTDPTWPTLAEVTTTAGEVVTLRLMACRYRRVTPFVFSLGGATAVGMIRIELPMDAGLTDQWPAGVGDTVRLIGDRETIEGLSVLFVTTHLPETEAACLRAWLGRLV